MQESSFFKGGTYFVSDNTELLEYIIVIFPSNIGFQQMSLVVIFL